MSEPEWLTCQQLCSAFSDDAHDSLRSALLLGASTGELTARAGNAVFGSGGHAAHVKHDWLIPPAAWRPTFDVAPQFSLKGGQLEGEQTAEALGIDSVDSPSTSIEDILLPAGVRPARDPVRFRFSRISFHRLDVLGFMGLEDHPAVEDAPAPSINKGGRRPSAGWPVFAAALGVWVQRRDDMASNIAAIGPDELLNQLDAILTSEWGEEQLARSTFQPGAQEFLRRMEEEAAKGR